jgi:hypothetical protein
MANPEHVELVKQGAEAIRKWREENRATQLELIEADLRGTDLGRAVLTETSLAKHVRTSFTSVGNEADRVMAADVRPLTS